jgi:hypothetical protein
MYNYKILFKYLCIFIFVSFLTNLNAQTGLNFQGVARNSNNVIISSQDITLRLSIVQGSVTGNTEYVEVRKVKTNAQGLFTAIIGDKETISTIGKFSDIDWKLSPKFLKIELDPTAGNNFINMGTTEFQYVAYAMFANSVLAENISGIVPVARGGTGSNSLTTLKSSLALDKVSNTADSLKSISKPTQSVLDLKLNLADSTKVFVTPTQLSKITFASGAVNVDTTSISNRINLKLNQSDTTALLKKSDTTNIYNRINLKLNSADTSSLSNRINLKLNQTDTSTLSNRINLKLNITDTSSLFRKTQVGAKNGAASLDALGKIPSVQIPAISFSSVDVVKTLEEMLSLPLTRVVGSIAVRLDSSKNFVLASLPASNRANWVELINPDAPVQTVNGKSGNITLVKSDFPDELDKVDNTSDLNKPVSNAMQDSLNTRLNIKDTSLLLQKVDTAAILAMYAKKFTKDVVVNFGSGGSLGKYKDKETIPAKGKTLDEFLIDLVSTSIPPTFYNPSVAISASPGFGSYEIGYVPGTVILNSNYTVNDGGSLTSTKYYKNGIEIPLGGSTIILDTLKTQINFSVRVDYDKGTGTKPDNLGTQFTSTIPAGFTTASGSITPFSKRYWGGIDPNTPLFESEVYKIESFKPFSSIDGSNKSFNYTFIPKGPQNVFFAYLATSPDLTTIIWGNIDYIESFTKSIIWLENAQGYKQQYKVYRSKETYNGQIDSIVTN